MQLSAPQVLDIRSEPEHILRMYGLDRENTVTPPQAHDRHAAGDRILRPQLPRCAAAAWSAACVLSKCGAAPTTAIRAATGIRTKTSSATTDRWPPGSAVGAAALIKDLKQRGMLDDTIVLWTTEFGRMPCNQGSAGRDHNPFVFTNWLAGGGVKGGVTLRRKRRVVVQAARPRQAHVLLRCPRHGLAPVGHRSQAAHLSPQRHRPPPDRCARRSDRGDHRVATTRRRPSTLWVACPRSRKHAHAKRQHLFASVGMLALCESMPPNFSRHDPLRLGTIPARR